MLVEQSADPGHAKHFKLGNLNPARLGNPDAAVVTPCMEPRAHRAGSTGWMNNCGIDCSPLLLLSAWIKNGVRRNQRRAR